MGCIREALFRAVVACLCALGSGIGAEAQEALVSLTPGRVDEPIQLAADDKAARRFLDSYVLQSRAGWGSGPLLGAFSTPYARIVQAALVARAQKKSFTASDVTPDLLVPELHVIVASDVAGIDDTVRATARSVFIVPRGGANGTDRIDSLKTTPLSQEYRERYGVAVAGAGVVAVFPLSAISPTNAIVVTLDRTAKGSSALSTCQNCAVLFDMAKLR